MKILIITYDFYPDNSPVTYRWFNILKEWVKVECEIHVVCASKDNQNSESIINGIHIHRTPQSIISKIKRNSNTAQDQTLNSTPIYVKKKKSILKIIHDATWKKIYFPDYAFLWQYSAYKLSKQIIEQNQIEKIISVSWPFTVHLVGYKLKKKYNLPWLLDTIDPFSLCDVMNNQFLYAQKNIRIEQKMFRAADKISVLTDKIKGKYISMFSAIENKIDVVPNIYVPLEKLEKVPANSNNKIIFVFVGTVTLVNRSPYNLLLFFYNLMQSKKLNKIIELHFYGELEQCQDIFESFDRLMPDTIFLHNFVSRLELNKILAAADVLLNVGNHSEYQEPSKIIEYIYFDKPIINVCNIQDDTSYNILKDYYKFFNVFPDEINNNAVFDKAVYFIDNVNSIEPNDKYFSNFEKFLLPAVSEKYFAVLKDLKVL